MSPAPVDRYVGTELELFAEAKRWKKYFATRIRPHLGRDVAEIGAGIGGTTALLSSGHRGRWLCLEPDQRLLGNVRTAITRGELPACCEARAATLSELDPGERFDSILYIDVLEHIEDDRSEARRAALHLRSGGKLVVLAPAHQWLFSPFDRAVGHFRRYTRRSLAAAVPGELTRIELSYLDSVGLLASAGNRFVSRSSSPSKAQIKLWDTAMIPLSRVLDPLTRYSLGKSVFGVWQKP